MVNPARWDEGRIRSWLVFNRTSPGLEEAVEIIEGLLPIHPNEQLPGDSPLEKKMDRLNRLLRDAQSSMDSLQYEIDSISREIDK
jgi:hypothetical protein